MKYTAQSRPIRQVCVGLGFAFLLAACGGGAAVAADPATAAIIETGEANSTELNTSGPVLDIEVLDVSSGEVATLAQTVDGDRPVLLWFFSPH